MAAITSNTPVGIGVVGLGGYGGRIIDTILEAARRDDHPPRLVAVTSSNPARHSEALRRLEDLGVGICSSFDDLLARSDVEAVWLPIPIDLHRPFMDRALAAGKAVMCEKPVAGSIDDCDLMIESRDRHGLPVAIGYQSIYDPATLALKRRVLGGELGRISSIVLHGIWPRDSGYYGRADWAGRLQRNGSWILDSPFQNALNHFPNLALFIAGPTRETSAVPVFVEAELYRANDIETYDTASIRLTLDTGATLLVLITHASDQPRNPTIRFVGDRGTATWNFDETITVDHSEGTDTIDVLDVEAQRVTMVAAFDRLVRGVHDPTRAVATLETSRATLVAVDGVTEAAPTHPVPSRHVREVGTARGATIRTIDGIAELVDHCAATGEMFHEAGLAEWTTAARGKDLAGYRHFAEPYGTTAD